MANDRNQLRQHARRGFTLIELLVVIGIIAVLISILLPVISKSRQNSITLKCQAQLRQQYHGLSMYAVNNRGRLPWGQYKIIDGGGATNWITWQTIVNQYFNPRAAITYKREAGSDAVLAGENRNANLFLCPAVYTGGGSKSSYACNMVAMPDKDYEEAYTDPTKQPLIQPSLMSKLYPHNILLFDTGSVVNSDGMYVVGYDVDYQYFSDPGDTQARFFRGDDPYQGNKYRGSALPVITEKDQNKDWVDYGTKSPKYPYQGNIRYRHNHELVANFAFADGHVETLRPDQVIRYMFKLRWPAGMPVSTGSWDEGG